MKQSRGTSAIKTVVSTGIGLAVAYFANMLILPLFGFPISPGANVLLTLVYTAISLARGYGVERLFEAFGWRIKTSQFAVASLIERQRQIDVERFDTAHDDRHDAQDLARAAAAYLIIDDDPVKACELWPWRKDELKPDGPRNNWKRGTALAIAAGDHLDRNRKRERKTFLNRAPHRYPPRSAAERARIMNQN